MLILTRRLGESLCLGNDIRITVVGFQGKQVKIGLDVPADMLVYREEVYRRIQEENRQSMLVNKEDMLAVENLWQKR